MLEFVAKIQWKTLVWSNWWSKRSGYLRKFQRNASEEDRGRAHLNWIKIHFPTFQVSLKCFRRLWGIEHCAYATDFVMVSDGDDRSLPSSSFSLFCLFGILSSCVPNENSNYALIIDLIFLPSQTTAQTSFSNYHLLQFIFLMIKIMTIYL